MNHNQEGNSIIDKVSPEFVMSVASQKDMATLRKMKLGEVDPDRRELIQSRMDNLYRKSYSDS